MSPAKSKLARVYQRSHPLPAAAAAAKISYSTCKLHPPAHQSYFGAPGVWRSALLDIFTAAAWRSPDAKAQIDYQIDSQQEAWHLPGDGHGLRRPAAGPREPSDTVWADSVASLFTAAARRGGDIALCQKHAVIARTALCTPVAVLSCPVPWDARSIPDTSECSCCRRP